jgi:hypothetical protein
MGPTVCQRRRHAHLRVHCERPIDPDVADPEEGCTPTSASTVFLYRESCPLDDHSEGVQRAPSHEPAHPVGPRARPREDRDGKPDRCSFSQRSTRPVSVRGLYPLSPSTTTIAMFAPDGVS